MQCWRIFDFETDYKFVFYSNIIKINLVVFSEIKNKITL
jgi:hypothetical protein